MSGPYEWRQGLPPPGLLVVVKVAGPDGRITQRNALVLEERQPIAMPDGTVAEGWTARLDDGERWGLHPRFTWRPAS